MITEIDTSKFKKFSIYKDFKNIVLGEDIFWKWMSYTTHAEFNDEHDNFGHYYHNFLTRPQKGICHFPHSPSEYCREAHNLVYRLLTEVNGIDFDVIYRMTANATYPTESGRPSVPHIDHPFPHKNLLIYLDGFDGDTVCEGDRKHFKEDDAIIFEGMHYHHPPSKGRRIVFIATFI